MELNYFKTKKNRPQKNRTQFFNVPNKANYFRTNRMLNRK